MSLDLRKLSQSGDTIVEVMLVLAVLGLAMSVSYATVNRSLLQAREAQENSDASSLVQSQLERIRTIDIASLKAATSPFCVDTSNAISHTACSPRPSYGLQLDVFYCGFSLLPPDVSGGACSGHTTDDTFYIRATWNNVQGEGTDEVSTSYRVH